MVERINLLFEIISVLLVLWSLHGSRKKPGISAVIYVCIELIIVSLIEEGWISSGYLCFAYIGIAVVDVVEFNDNLKNAVIYTIADFFFLFAFQMICGVLYSILFHTSNVTGFAILAINIIIICCSLLLFKFNLHKHISIFLEKGIITNIIMMILGVILLFLLLRQISTLEFEWDLLVFVLLFIAVVIIILFKLERETIQKKQYLEQLHQYEQYNIVYKDLITEMRHRQHDFDNHLQAIYSISMACDSIDELRKEFSDYYNKLNNDHYIYHLLKGSVPSVLVAFLYIKFKSLQDKGIYIDYELKISDIEKKILFPDIVELVGNLIDNAAEETMKNGSKDIRFSLVENDIGIQCRISNTYEGKNDEELKNIMQDGYSSKGKGRGYGLTNVNRIIEKYHGSIQVGLDVENNVKIITFDIFLPFNKEIS